MHGRVASASCSLHNKIENQQEHTLLNLSTGELLFQNSNLLHSSLRDARHLDTVKEGLIVRHDGYVFVNKGRK